MTIAMFDSAYNNQFPPGGGAYAGYVDGHVGDQPNYPWIVKNFPKAHHLSITLTPGLDADCLDIETHAATVASAAGWFTRQKARGAVRPVFYASVSLMQSDLVAALAVAGIDRSQYRLWSAHYGNGNHICGPRTCRLLSITADGTQWTDHDDKLTVDQSVLSDGFFGGAVNVTYQSVTVSMPVLIPGANDATFPHEYVRRVQVLLKDIYGSYKGAFDGIYGPVTVEAVKQTQGQLGLTQDGICGPGTWKGLVQG